MFTLACIPAYDEEGRIGKTILEVSQYVDKVIVCDDGSSDNTANEAEMSGAYVIRHQKNIGKGAAMKSLFKFARASNSDIVITIDADRQFLPKEIPILIKPIIEQNADIVVGYRFDDKTEMPKYRKIGNKMLDKITNMAESVPIRDTKRGEEEFTPEIPNVSDEAIKDLDENGIIRVGAKVKEGDILIGKITPKGESDPTPEERLLRAIFGDKAGDVKDASLKAPLSLNGVVVDTKLFTRQKKDKDSKKISKQQIVVLKSEYSKSLLELKDRLIKKFETLLNNKI